MASPWSVNCRLRLHRVHRSSDLLGNAESQQNHGDFPVNKCLSENTLSGAAFYDSRFTWRIGSIWNHIDWKRQRLDNTRNMKEDISHGHSSAYLNRSSMCKRHKISLSPLPKLRICSSMGQAWEKAMSNDSLARKKVKGLHHAEQQFWYRESNCRKCSRSPGPICPKLKTEE